ncbi:Zinc-finger domain-containing protein [Plasmodiophora brassicae]|uniref:Zinc-finger domain-containing protein n=1 Tax=Plasmodiophora brassicae TaxID=37360 RepID=A0A0G4IHS9_PLABS|nr:hypothetical protein PBRA_003582 [Plasmodiophora brassicae]
MESAAWDKVLSVIREGHVQACVLKYTDEVQRPCEATVDIADGNAVDNLPNGVLLPNGLTVIPDVESVIANPYGPVATLEFRCRTERRDQTPSSVTSALLYTEPADALIEPIELSSPTLKPRLSPVAAIGVPDEPPQLTLLTGPDRMPPPMAAVQRGTSCHQCKNARTIDQLAFCSNKFAKRTSADMRKCRKKFCQGCLAKFYNDSIDNAKSRNDWICPSCRGCCRCAACTRKRQKALSDSSALFGAHDVTVSDILGGSGGRPTMPDEQVEAQGAVVRQMKMEPMLPDSIGKVQKQARRVSAVRSEPYPTGYDGSDLPAPDGAGGSAVSMP